MLQAGAPDLNVHITTNAPSAAKSATAPSIAHTGPIEAIPFEFFPLPKQATTPVNIPMLHNFLLDHADKEFVTFIIKGFSHGFRIGYKNSHIKPDRKRNLKGC